MRTRLPRLLPALSLAVALVACTTTVSGTPVGQGSVVAPDRGGAADTSFVKNTDGGEIDRLAATVVDDVRAYWTDAFPSTFDTRFDDLAGGYYSVDTSDADSPKPPCADSPVDVEGNAFYCPTSDAIAWDRAALLPVLRERFGEAAVVLVLAHEIGHAVQARTGVGMEQRRADPQAFPTILIEAMADCYAGSFVRWVADGKAPHLSIEKERLDSALESLISFRDPIGTDQTDGGAHGDAFDRVSAFQDGYDRGAELCAGMTVGNREFTLTGFTNADDAARGGNVEFDQIVGSITPGLDTYFGGLVTRSGKEWAKPEVKAVAGNPTCDGGEQGPVAYCATAGTIELDDRDDLPGIHGDIGDYATGTLLAGRYALAARAAVGKPLDGADAQRSVVCLTGSFTRSLFDSAGQYLSPGDLDEAVQVLLDYDYAARDAKGAAIPAGFDRVAAFRAGFTGGDGKCGLV
ncbi:neutral zinc metallopeptidase [Actinokineospora spheciospongiae]|uniref:neutral zinc metallopeptidase n=1 Tax=Actinokineospora spheciospongiae TaxID=909613 RepID=UPI0004B63889|nr:neutral zinc metallopeptidase [Actinokineospora spheciospongiae]PWW55459.1 putative metalloprotease [Actinokineospora spheciospongiae]